MVQQFDRFRLVEAGSSNRQAIHHQGPTLHCAAEVALQIGRCAVNTEIVAMTHNRAFDLNDGSVDFIAGNDNKFNTADVQPIAERWQYEGDNRLL